MRERINRLAKGIIDRDVPKFRCNPQEINLQVHAGETIRNEIVIYSDNGIHLKGLAYSSDPRVRILTPSFGGVKIHLGYETDSRFLKPEECIEGDINLVSNAGEYSVHYKFRVVSGSAGKTLGNLKSIEDLALIAKEDPDTALRLFEYKDFVMAPFMKDIKARALYDGFRGRANRANALEEFLISMRAKLPVEVTVEDGLYTFDMVTDMTSASIGIDKNNWGHISYSVKASEDFLVLSTRHITDADFSEGHMDYAFAVDPKYLHAGKNSGSITFTSVRDSFVVPVEAAGIEEDDDDYLKDRKIYHKKHIANYAKLRVRYECEPQNQPEIIEEMLKELNRLSTYTEKKEYITLLKAEAELLGGHTEQTILLLDTVRDTIKTNRQEMIEEYFMLEYLDVSVYKQETRKESLVRLIHKFMEEEHMSSLFLYLIRLDKTVKSDPSSYMKMMKKLYSDGYRSPFLYIEYCKFLSDHTDYLHDLTDVDIHALYFGARYGLIGEELSDILALRTKTMRTYHSLLYPILRLLYDKSPSQALLTSICTSLIRGDRREKSFHSRYKQGVDEKIAITGLYEYYVYTLPADYHELLPEDILVYFVHDSSLDIKSKAMVYANVILYMKHETNLYKEYLLKIQDFAVNQIASGHIDNNLAVIYKTVLKPDMVDIHSAKMLSGILKTYYIHVDSELIRAIAVVYPELKSEDVYTLEEGSVYAPLYSSRAIVLLQDAYGNRYYNIPLTKQSMLSLPEIEEACTKLCPDHIMMRIHAVDEILKKGIQSKEDADMLEDTLTSVQLSDSYRKLVFAQLIKYYESENPTDHKPNFLIDSDKGMLSSEERVEICDALIRMEYIKEAYEMIKVYDCEGISQDNLILLCKRMILDNLFTEDDLLLHLANKAMSYNSHEGVILDYLCEHYNGTTQEMYLILKNAVLEHTETYDLEERLLAQMLFTDGKEHLDEVFEWYVSRKKTSENLVKAYFAVKCADYFLNDISLPEASLDYLESAMKQAIEPDKMPTIYQLAITRYYSTLERLSEDRLELAEKIIDHLLDIELRFPYYKKLAAYIHMPDEILDKAMITYKGTADSHPVIKSRITPYESDYHTDSIKRMYQNIFVRDQVLFAGEVWEYKIYDGADEADELQTEGSITYDADMTHNTGSRFDMLNNLSVKMDLRDEDGLKVGYQDYTKKQNMSEKLFTIK